VNADVINSNPKILRGTPVFKGTRVPIETLFDHLESGVYLDEFLDDFPSVTKEQAIELLEIAGRVVSTKNFKTLYEATS